MMGPPSCASRYVAMQLRNFVVGGNIVVLIEEERRGVDPVGAAMHVGRAMHVIGAGCRAQVDVRAGGRALLRVVHRRVHAHFGNVSGAGVGMALPMDR